MDMICRVSQEMYKRLPKFNKNSFPIPANKQGKRFLSKYVFALLWANYGDETQPFAGTCNTIFLAICLEISNPIGK